MLEELGSEERLQLMKFVCSFAWADLEVSLEERGYVLRAVERLDLDDRESAQVRGWLEVPPRAEDVDPTRIPNEHRELFLRTVEEVIVADGLVRQEELENLVLFKKLLA